MNEINRGPLLTCPGTAGNASKIKPLSLDDMVKRYDKGELAPKVN